MTAITNGTTTIDVEKTTEGLHVTLEAGNYHYQEIKRYPPYLAGNDLLLPGELVEATDERLEISYTVPPYAQSLAEAVVSMDELERLRTARALSVLNAYEHKVVHLFLHPDNLFLAGGKLQVAHRGLTEVVAPETLTPEAFLSQYKALVLSVVQPKASFESLVTGNLVVKDAFSQEILTAASMTVVEERLNKQYQAQKRTQEVHQRLVKKAHYAAFQWATLVLAVATIGLGIWLGILQGVKWPKEERIIASQTAFITNNYDKATQSLAQDKAQDLPKGAQYSLAASYVHLENLTNEQKNAILNNLSINSSTNELLYWIANGRGNLDEALSIAQNIGDNQLILHAYTKLYDAIQADAKMSGGKKQEKLSEYKKKIDEYVKLLGGQRDGTKE